MGVLGDRWSLLVVRELLYGATRYSDVAAGTGAATDVVAARLKHLVEAGVVEKRQYSARPPRFGYHLTEAGLELAPVLVLLLGWGDRWANDRVPVVLEHGPDAHPVRPELVCADCGQPVHVGLRAHTAAGEVIPLS